MVDWGAASDPKSKISHLCVIRGSASNPLLPCICPFGLCKNSEHTSCLISGLLLNNTPPRRRSGKTLWMMKHLIISYSLLLWSIYIAGCYYQMQSKYSHVWIWSRSRGGKKNPQLNSPPGRNENKPFSLLMRGEFLSRHNSNGERSRRAGEDPEMQIKRTWTPAADCNFLIKRKSILSHDLLQSKSHLSG